VKKTAKPPREFPVTVTNKPAPSGATKRPTLQQQNTQAPKKFRMSAFKDISLAEAGKYGSLNEFAFFDKVCIEIHTLCKFKHWLFTLEI
jgi:hypothetical protein